MVFASCVGLCIVLLNCNDKSNSNPTSPSGSIEATETYSVSGNALTINIPAGANNYCDSNTLIVSPADSNVMQFEISGNTLKTYDPPDSNYSYSNPSLIIQTYSTFTRASGGPGLTGAWNLTSNGYNVLSGTPTASEKSSLDAEYTSVDYLSSFQIEFTGSTVIIRGNISYAEFFMMSWNMDFGVGGSADSARYAITLATVGANSVRMAGTITGEVVTLTFANNGDVTYSSGVQGHATGTYYAKPTSCPNSPPAWFQTFIQANAKPGPTLYKAHVKKKILNSWLHAGVRIN
jgi:hypothetical protein